MLAVLPPSLATAEKLPHAGIAARSTFQVPSAATVVLTFCATLPSAADTSVTDSAAPADPAGALP